MNASVRCPHCGQEVAGNHRYCAACGEPLPAAGRQAKRRDEDRSREAARTVDDYLKAVSTFERMLHGGRTSAVRTLVGRGDALAALGEYEQAEAAYNEALAEEPGRRDVRVALARLHNRTAHYPEAMSLCAALLREDPRDSEVYLVDARARLASGDFKGILDLSERARDNDVASPALTRVAELARRRFREVEAGAAVVQEVFVIHASTRLVAHRSRLFRPNIDSDLVAGTLRAIQDFIQVALLAPEAGAPPLNELKYGSFIVLVESRNHFQVAFVVSGAPDLGLRHAFSESADDIERTFGHVLADWDGTLEHVRGVQQYLERRFFPPAAAGEVEPDAELA
jgi:tetratricopeptide (TPR) repeat protein